MYEVKHVSPSQIKTWRSCNRKWHFEKVGGIRQPTTESQQLGTDVHSILEHYVENGTVIPDNYAGQIAKAALPMVNTNSKCEHQFTLPLVEGILATGRIDFTHVGIIEDLKTTSSMRYAKKPEELKSDPQAIMYLWAAQNDPGLAFFAPINKFAHLIVETKTPHKTRRVDCELTTDEIEEGMRYIRQDAIAMREAASKPVEHVQYNIDACSMYGGCHLQERCLKLGLFAAPRRKDEEMNPLFAKFLKEKEQETADGTPAPRITPEEGAVIVKKGPPAPEPEPMPETVEPSAINPPDGTSQDVVLPPPDMKKGRQAALAVPKWVADHGGKSPSTLKKQEAIDTWGALKDAVYSSGGQVDVKSIYSILDWNTDGKTAAEIKTQVKALIEALPEGFEPAPAPVQEQTPAPEPVQEQTPAPEPVQEQTPAPAPVQEQTPAPAPVQEQDPRGWLFVGCRPAFSVQVTNLEDILEPIREAVMKSDEKGRHWLLIADYGVNGSHKVAAALHQVISKGTNLPAVVQADYRLPGHTEAIAVLRKFYRVVEAL